MRMLLSAVSVFVISLVLIYLWMFIGGRATGLGYLRAYIGPMFVTIGLLYLAAGLGFMLLVRG